jgi:23S rRNA pseudouridine1911/1915/1917 synthase
VHLESLQRHILGDTLYGFKGNIDKLKRVYLHAYSLYLKHPITNKDMSFNVSLPEDMDGFYKENFDKGYNNDKIDENYIINSFTNFS